MAKKKLVSGVMHVVSIKPLRETIRVDYKRMNGGEFTLYAHRDKETGQISLAKGAHSNGDSYHFASSNPEVIEAFLICAGKAMDYFGSNK